MSLKFSARKRGELVSTKTRVLLFIMFAIGKSWIRTSSITVINCYSSGTVIRSDILNSYSALLQLQFSKGLCSVSAQDRLLVRSLPDFELQSY